MARFTENAKAKIQVSDLENHPSDRLQKELHKEQKEAIKDKTYIKRNIRTVHAIERANKNRKPLEEKWVHRTGELPTYLVNKKKKAEEEEVEIRK